ncbi:hypothetical protein WJX79_009417 [Trebouxia sp. C0005]
MRQVSRGSWQACGSKSVCTKHNTQGGSLAISRARTKATNRWEVQVTQKWEAMRRLGEVSSLATDVFYKNEGFEPLINFSKIIYKSELLIRLARDVRSVALFVYRDNYTAIRLYERVGFERVVNWVDPLWLACAEKGMIGPTRRVLYIKQLPSVMK